MKTFNSIFVLALFAACAMTGCKTRSVVETSLAHPSIEIVGSGVKFQGKYVMPQDVPDILEDHGVSHDTVIHIRVHQLDRLHEAQAFRGLLARHGYRRTALVTKEHAESTVVSEPREPVFRAPPPPPADWRVTPPPPR